MFNIRELIKEITESITGVKDRLLENLPGEAKMHNAFDSLKGKVDHGVATLRARFHSDGHGAEGGGDIPSGPNRIEGVMPVKQLTGVSPAANRIN